MRSRSVPSNGAGEQRRGDHPRADGVDADVFARVIDGQGARVVDDAAFGGVVRGQAVVAAEAGDRGGVDDAAAAGGAQMRNGGAAAVEDGEQIDLRIGAPDLGSMSGVLP